MDELQSGAKDTQAALHAKLEAASAKVAETKADGEADKQSPEPEVPTEGEDGEPVVSISHRALPLIELLEAAAKAECNVMWDGND
jgi:hypothetical protein